MRLTVAIALVLALLPGCKPAPAPAPAPAAAPAAPAAPAADSAAIIERSRDVLRAIDAEDAGKLEQLLAEGFAFVDNNYFTPRAPLLESVRARAGEPFPRTVERTWSEENVRFFGTTAIFNGRTSARLLRSEGAPPIAIERYITHVWVGQDGRWQLAHWQSEDAGVEATRRTWNEFFRTDGYMKLTPNAFLVNMVAGRKPGKALDVGMGQGRNALHLAAQGWQVTGVDISDEGVRQARESAARQGLALEAINADVDSFDYGEDRWDLICFIYMGMPDQVDVLRKALRKGGLVVVEFAGDGADAVTPAGFKDGFRLLFDERVEGVPDFGKRKRQLVRLVAQKL